MNKVAEPLPANLEGAPLEDILSWACDQFFPRLAFASSFSVEDVVLIDAATRLCRDFPVIALDTGRLPEETYAVAEEWRRRGVRIRWFFPKTETVEALENERGLYSFRQSLDDRHRCCAARKVEPLSRALQGLRAWVTGQRREQSVTRGSLAVVEVDAAHGNIVKLNPLAAWTEAEVWERVRERRLPYNALHDKGYPSIGCAPCTRAVEPGEHPRAGRWGWELPEHKECGLHLCPVGVPSSKPVNNEKTP